MARGQPLTPAVRRHAAALGAALALALLLHALAWWWVEPLLASRRDAQAALSAFKPPLLTRMLAPQAPAAVPRPAPQARNLARSSGGPSNPATPAARVIDPQAAQPGESSAPAPRTEDPAPGTQAATLADAIAAASDAPGTVDKAASVAPPAVPAPRSDPPASWPSDTRLSYRLQGFYRGPIDGDAQVTWQREGDRYQVQIAIRMALFLRVTLTSQGRIEGNRLVPASYQEQMPNRTRSVRIEGPHVLLGNGTALPRPDGVQDTASQFVALSQRFATGAQALADGEVVRLWMARPGGLDEWAYDVRGPVALDTRPWGAVKAFHLVPRPVERPRGNISAQIWFAPALQYLPARIRIALGEEAWLDLMVDRIEQAAR